jgi:hypothetical protein
MRNKGKKRPWLVVQKYLGDGWVDITEPLFTIRAKKAQRSFEKKEPYSAFRIFDLKMMSPRIEL